MKGAGIDLVEVPALDKVFEYDRKESAMTQVKFGGDRKTGKWAFANLERRMVTWLVPKVPSWIETYHLTMLTLAWSVGIVVASLLARQNLHWLWLVSGFIALQYLSDVLDGAVGRYRDTGLVKWGFYMDHFLDFLFLASVIVGYSLALPHIEAYWFAVLLVVGGALMVNTFLSFAATNEFQISTLGIGPTEIRLFFVLANAGMVFFGTAWLTIALPVVVGILTLALAWSVWQSHQRIWKIDMVNKRRMSGD